MTLPSSGPLSLSDIRGEFGGGTPISLGSYYAGGGLVPPGTSGTYGPVPSSGALSIQNFYGTSTFIPHTDTYFGGSGTAVVPAGATSLTIRVQGGSGAGGYGDYDGVDNWGGGGGGAGGWVERTVSLNSGDWGTGISFTVGEDGTLAGHLDGYPGTVSGAVSGGGIGITAYGGSAGLTGQPGAPGAGGGATGGNTNTPGSNGDVGSSGSGGAGGTNSSSGAGGGNGGYGASGPGTDGFGAVTSFAWS